MKSLIQTQALQADAGIANLVTQLNATAEATFHPTTDGLWDRKLNVRGRVVLQLRVTDQGGEALGEFVPEELSNQAHMIKRLASLQVAIDRVRQWKERLSVLFAQIRAWAATLPGGTPVITETPLNLREERSGEYTAGELTLQRGDAEMKVVPIAAWVVGADGRVDLKGTGGSFVLIYQVPDGWQHVRERYPNVSLEPLTEGLFHQLAKVCLDA